MLQWMGGSRRKVTTARKSTQRRQKQYFEQKKRRQQQQAAGLNKFGDGMDGYGQRQKEHHRSLDILSFLNFSTMAQQHRSGGICLDQQLLTQIGIDHLKAIDSKIETETAHDISVATMDTNTHVCPTGLKREVPASAHNVKAASSEKIINKVCLKAPVDPGRRPVEEMYQWEIFPEANMSILDFLGDDGTDQSTEVKPANEDHAAFSVDGLGRAGTETPVNSPQHRIRTFSYGAFSSCKGPRDFDLFVDHINASYEFDPRCEVDSSIPDVNGACSLGPGSFSFSQHIWDPFSIPEHEPLRFYSSFKHNLDDTGQKLSSACCTDNSSRHMWNDQDAVSSDDGHLYGKNYEVTSMDCPFRWDSRSGDYTSACCRNQGSFDRASDSVYLQKKRYNFKAKDDSSILDIPAQKFSAEIGCSYMVMEDPNDRLSSESFGSEESCSSTAVSGKMSNSSSLDAGLRKTRNKYAGATQPRTVMSESGDHEGVTTIKSKRSLHSTMHLKKVAGVTSSCRSGTLIYPGSCKEKTALTGCGPWKAEATGAYPELDIWVEDH